MWEGEAWRGGQDLNEVGYFFFFNSENNGNCESLIHALLTPKHFLTYKKIRHVVIPQGKELTAKEVQLENFSPKRHVKPR